MGTIMQDILIVVDYLRKQLGITAEYQCIDYPQTEEEFLNQLRWISGVDEHNSCLFTDEKLISWQQIQEYKDVAFSSFAKDLLRVERNKLLTQTDWWALSDNEISEERRLYRQRLRDITINATPRLDEYNNLIIDSVQWPTKPE